MPFRSFRWYGTLYALAWLPLFALYTFLFSVSELSVPHALVMASFYTVPPAVLAVLVIRACVALPWSSQHRVRFVGRHIGMGCAFAALSAVAAFSLFSLFPWNVEAAAEESNNAAAFLLFQFFLDSLLYCIVVGFTYAALGEVRTRRQAAAAARAEALRAQAELRALRAQVNPHFLFNTLHSVLALVRTDPPAAEEALEQFGDLMRYALRVQQDVGDEVPFTEEWAFSSDYLALEALRLGERLQVHTDIEDAATGCALPAFSLQPLLENSIGHAIAPRAAGGNVWIKAKVVDGCLTLSVRDDGPGASADAIEAADGTGLRLLRRRLAALHGDAASVEAGTDTDGFTVTVRLPAMRASSAAPVPPAIRASGEGGRA